MILVTGCAGFIGYFVAKQLLDEGREVLGVDNLNDYYDVKLKEYRLEQLKKYEKFKFVKLDIENYDALKVLFETYEIEKIVNLAARAGVRYSMENPFVYMTTNANATLNLLELAKEFSIKKFVLASTSSLYAGQKMPFVEDLPVNSPISPYAASKKAAEVMAYTYHYLYDLDVTILRYFTVYGPAGRPDMSVFRFIYWILKGEEIELFGDGTQSRDFTFVEDIARGTILALDKEVGYEIINLGNNSPNKLNEVLAIIEEELGKKSKIRYLDFHKTDMKATWANIDKAKNILNWNPLVSVEEGIERTVNWMLENWNWIKQVKI